MKRIFFASLVATIFIAACGHDMGEQPENEYYSWKVTVAQGFGYSGYEISVSGDGKLSNRSYDDTGSDETIEREITEAELKELNDLIAVPSFVMQHDITAPTDGSYICTSIGSFPMTINIKYGSGFIDGYRYGGLENSFSIEPEVLTCFEYLIPDEVKSLTKLLNRLVCLHIGCYM